MKRILAVSVLVGAVLLAGAVARAAEPFSYDDWTAVLQAHVDDEGLVDYEGLARDRGKLDRYLAEIERRGPKSDPAAFPTRDHELAYYLNGYNALVFAGVLDRGPEKESVWSGLISGYTFFVRMKVTIDGWRTNLRELENEGIREEYGDARVHAALNCASIGCPRLPREAFRGKDLDRQLDAAMREFVDSPRNVEVDDAQRSVTLSKIFDWFRDDFLAAEREAGNDRATLLDYVNRYRSRDRQVPDGYDIRFSSYDKRINSR